MIDKTKAIQLLIAAQKDECMNYLYKGEISTWDSKKEPWSDADSGRFIIDLGFNHKVELQLRLGYADSWETRGAERLLGIRAKEWIRQFMPKGTKFQLLTDKDMTGGFGRYLAYILVEYKGKHLLLDDLLIDLEHATPYEKGGKKKRLPQVQALLKKYNLN